MMRYGKIAFFSSSKEPFELNIQELFQILDEFSLISGDFHMMRQRVKRCQCHLRSALERLMLADELGLRDLRSACVNFLTLPGNLEAAQASEMLAELTPELCSLALRWLSCWLLVAHVGFWVGSQNPRIIIISAKRILTAEM